jgi:hypothetical protein
VQGISRVANDLLASQEKLCFMQLVKQGTPVCIDRNIQLFWIEAAEFV